MTFLTPYYNIKVYTSAGSTYIRTINQNKIMSKISFTQNVGGGQGELVIDIDEPFATNDFNEGNIIKVFEFNDANTSGRQVYSGKVTKIGRKQTTNSETVSLTCLGLAELLNKVIINSSYTGVDPADIIKDILDQFDPFYPGLISYSGGGIVNYGSTMSIIIDRVSATEAIKMVTDQAPGTFFFVDGTGQASWGRWPTSSTHLLTNQKDIQDIELTENIETVINYVEAKYQTGTTITGEPIYGYVTSTDIPSQSQNGFSGDFIDITSVIAIGDTVGAQQYADSYIQINKDKKIEMTIVVNSNYDVVSILPGHSFKILNFDYLIENVPILKTSYNGTTTTLTLGRIFTIGTAINT